jgi:hypothetical protein
VTYDNILVTDQPLTGQKDSCFADDFGAAVKKGWLDWGDKDIVQQANGKLSVSTFTAGAISYPYVNVAMGDTFVSRTIVSNISGRKSAMYGFFIFGDPGTGTAIPMALFTITGDRKFDAFSMGDTIKQALSTVIHGAPYQTTYYWDTIDVVKQRNNMYIMIVNGENLDTLAASKVKFTPAGAGVFCDESLHVDFDYFLIGKSWTPCPVTNLLKNSRIAQRIKFAPYSSEYLFDPLGRMVRMKALTNRVYARQTVPGFYIMPSGKSGIVVKNK